MPPTYIRLTLPLAIAATLSACPRPREGELMVQDSLEFIPVSVDTRLLDDSPPPVRDAAPPGAVAADPEPEDRCDPNYTPCVPIDSDVDCEGGRGNGPSYVAGPVQVIGRDVYRLDADHDGVGCEG